MRTLQTNMEEWANDTRRAFQLKRKKLLSGENDKSTGTFLTNQCNICNTFNYSTEDNSIALKSKLKRSQSTRK